MRRLLGVGADFTPKGVYEMTTQYYAAMHSHGGVLDVLCKFTLDGVDVEANDDHIRRDP